MPHTPSYWIGLGDLHGHVANLSRIPELAGAAGVIVSGDLTVKGGVPEARQVIEAIAAINPAIHAQIGNMDLAPVEPWLDERGLGMHARCLELAPGLGLLGLGWSNPTPFNTPSEVDDAQLGSWLEQAYAMAQKTTGFDTLLLVSHTPPFDTAADQVSPGVHVGSQAVRDFILRVRPALCLTGHIHEARSVDALGDTVILNPGDLGSGGYARIDWDGRTLTGALRLVSDSGWKGKGGRFG